MNFAYTAADFIRYHLELEQRSVKQIIETFNIPVLLVSDSSTIIEANLKAIELFGFDVETLKSVNLAKIISDLNLEQPKAVTQTLYSGQGDCYIVEWNALKLNRVVYDSGVSSIVVGEIKDLIIRKKHDHDKLQNFIDLFTNLAQQPNLLDTDQFHDESLQPMLSCLPGAAYIKSKKYGYTHSNEYMLEIICGIDTFRIVAGRDDYYLCDQIIGRRWPSQFISSIRLDDIQVVEQRIPVFNKTEIPFLSVDNQVIIQSTRKIPLTNHKGQVTGVFGFSYDISEQIDRVRLLDIYHKFHDSNAEAVSHFIKHVLRAKQDSPLYLLTNIELVCALYLAKGLTMKQIARILLLSPRTIESHVNRTRDKLEVGFKSEIIQLFNIKYKQVELDFA